MKSKSKKRLEARRQEGGFVSYWPSADRPTDYNPLVDKHNLYYFQLPSVQKHLKKLKRKVKKEQETNQKHQLLEGLDKNSFIFGYSKVNSSKRIDYQPTTPKYSRRNAQSSRSLNSKRYVHRSEQRPKFSSVAKLPPVNSRAASPQRLKTQKAPSIDRDNMMEMIIKRRLGTSFQ